MPESFSHSSAFGVFLCGPRVELEADDGLVADDPRVVPRLDHTRGVSVTDEHCYERCGERCRYEQEAE